MKNPESKPFLKQIKRLGGAGAIFLGSLIINSDQHYDEIVELPTEREIPFDSEDIIIMTANVHSWSYHGSDAMEDIKAVLSQESPDVLCLQEVTTRDNKLRELNEQGYNVIFAATYYHPLNGPFGNAVISKNPLRLSEVHSLPNPATVSPRNAVVFEVQDKNGDWLPLVNTHLSTNTYERQLQINRLNREVGDQVLGICADANDEAEFVRNNVVALSSQTHFGRLSAPMPVAEVDSFPSINPRRAIDMIIVPCGELNRPTRALEIGSDHLGVIKSVNTENCDY